MLKGTIHAKEILSKIAKILTPISGNKRFRSDIIKSNQYEIMNWKGIEIVTRKKSVDQEQVSWMGESLFWNMLEEGPIRKSDIVLDLGAHIGSFAVLAAVIKKCKVFAFEPDYESFSLCKINTILNSVEGRVESLCAAVAGKNWKSNHLQIN